MTNEVREWLCALVAFDFGDRELLANLIRSGTAPPKEFVPAIADIVSGERAPNMVAARKAKVPAAERMKLAIFLDDMLSLINAIKRDAQEIGDRKGKEPIEIVREMERETDELLNSAEKEFGVGRATLKAMIRDLYRRAEQWPIV